MSDLSVFDNKVLEDGLIYYVFPIGYPLFKANRTLSKGSTIVLRPNRPYFFGLKNMNDEYIESFEDEYGVIFEFVLTREYKLLALDDKRTQTILYNSSPEIIKTILENNFGYISGYRNSVSEPDRIISEYLCSNGYQGYAIQNMITDSTQRLFHDELMICNTDGLQYVRQVTPQTRVQGILESWMLKSLSRNMKQNRKKRSQIINLSEDNDFKPPGRLKFDDFEESGGKKTRRRKLSRKSRKSRKCKKKYSRQR